MQKKSKSKKRFNAEGLAWKDGRLVIDTSNDKFVDEVEIEASREWLLSVIGVEEEEDD